MLQKPGKLQPALVEMILIFEKRFFAPEY